MREMTAKMREIMVADLSDYYSREGYFVGSWDVYDYDALAKIFSDMPDRYLCEEHDEVFNAPMEV